MAAIVVLAAGIAATRAALVHSLPWWVGLVLLAWLVACAAHVRRTGRGATLIQRDGDDWFLSPADARSVDPLPAAPPPASPSGDARAGRHDPLVLLPPRYRSGWLASLSFRDATGAVRHLDVWSDSTPARDFSYLHLACLLDIERAPPPPGPASVLGYTARRLANGLGSR